MNPVYISVSVLLLRLQALKYSYFSAKCIAEKLKSSKHCKRIEKKILDIKREIDFYKDMPRFDMIAYRGEFRDFVYVK